MRCPSDGKSPQPPRNFEILTKLDVPLSKAIVQYGQAGKEYGSSPLNRTANHAAATLELPVGKGLERSEEVAMS